MSDWQPFTNAELATEVVAALRAVESVLSEAYGHEDAQYDEPPAFTALSLAREALDWVDDVPTGPDGRVVGAGYHSLESGDPPMGSALEVQIVAAMREAHETLQIAYGHAEAQHEPSALHALTLLAEALEWADGSVATPGGLPGTDELVDRIRAQTGLLNSSIVVTLNAAIDAGLGGLEPGCVTLDRRLGGGFSVAPFYRELGSGRIAMAPVSTNRDEPDRAASEAKWHSQADEIDRLGAQRDALGQALGEVLVAMGGVTNVRLSGPQLLAAARDAVEHLEGGPTAHAAVLDAADMAAGGPERDGQLVGAREWRRNTLARLSDAVVEKVVVAQASALHRAQSTEGDAVEACQLLGVALEELQSRPGVGRSDAATGVVIERATALHSELASSEGRLNPHELEAYDELGAALNELPGRHGWATRWEAPPAGPSTGLGFEL